MTTIADVTSRLKRHAQGTENANDQGNLADYVWMLNHQGVTAGTGELWEQLQFTFEKLNKLFNAARELQISRSLAYAVNGLLMLCLDQAASARCSESARAEMIQLAWRIGAAYDAVLAGDVESIGQHVRLEESARTMESLN